MIPQILKKKSWLTALFAVGLAGTAAAQPAKDDVAKIIKDKNFVFRAQSANPTGGRTRQLTSEYGLQVKSDTLVSFLPYFGRSFSAPVDPTKGGIDFTSTDFEYKETPAKKSGWNININPKDAGDVQSMVLSVSESGYGTLMVRSNNRQAISFYGFVDKPREKKE